MSRAICICTASLGLICVNVSLARASPAEVPVCVDVVVQRVARPKPKPAPPQSLDGPLAAPGPRIDSAAAPEKAPNPAAARSEPEATGALELSAEVTQDARVQSGAHLPLGQTPETYLARLLEHFVTHERGFVAVKRDCQQRIVVELYPLRVGWTAFARYTGSGREERVDQLLPTELSQFAERSVLSLLHDISIHDTVDRNNVLWSDSLKSSQTIHGRNHFTFGLGTRVRAGVLESVANEGGDGRAHMRLRALTPFLMQVGYRGQFEGFGVEAAGELDFGTGQVAAKRNPTGGQTDFVASAGLVLHAFRYADVRGLSSLYYGGGATFIVHWFSVVKPEEERDGSARSALLGGGLEVDGVLGYEFMRASALSFFLEGEVNVPTYAVRNENSAGKINTWFPGAALKLGVIF